MAAQTSVQTSSVISGLMDVNDIINAFVEPTRETQVAGGTKAMMQTKVIYTWPDQINDRTKLAVLLMLTSCGRSESTRTDLWQSWMLTYNVLCFPEIADIMRNKKLQEYEIRPLSNAFVEACFTAVNSAMTTDQDDFVTTVAYPPELPDGSAYTLDARMLASLDMTTLYSYGALVLFLAGKQINQTNRTSITESRPRALIGEFKLTTFQAFILTGDGRMSSNAHTYVNAAWSLAEAPRIVILEHYCSVRITDMILTQRVFNNTLSMLEYSGMHAVQYIHKLLVANPWVVQMPALTASYMIYAGNIRRLHDSPAKFQKFLKLIHGNSTTFMRRRDYAPLIAVAIFWARQHSSTLKNFVVEEGNHAVVEQFITECGARNIRVNAAPDQAIASLAN